MGALDFKRENAMEVIQHGVVLRKETKNKPSRIRGVGDRRIIFDVSVTYFFNSKKIDWSFPPEMARQLHAGPTQLLQRLLLLHLWGWAEHCHSGAGARPSKAW